MRASRRAGLWALAINALNHNERSSMVGPGRGGSSRLPGEDFEQARGKWASPHYGRRGLRRLAFWTRVQLGCILFEVSSEVNSEKTSQRSWRIRQEQKGGQ